MKPLMSFITQGKKIVTNTSSEDFKDLKEIRKQKSEQKMKEEVMGKAKDHSLYVYLIKVVL